MSDPRDVWGDEGAQARLSARAAPTIALEDGTRFFHCKEDRQGALGPLRRGWYLTTPTGGIVLHWTRKSDVLVEISALLRGGDE